jgi:hypothetical protein
MGLSDDARAAATRPQHQPQTSTPKRLRRAKLFSAFAITAVVGIGSYAATYRALVIYSTPSAPTGSIAPGPTGSAASTTVPTTQTHP